MDANYVRLFGTHTIVMSEIINHFDDTDHWINIVICLTKTKYFSITFVNNSNYMSSLSIRTHCTARPSGHYHGESSSLTPASPSSQRQTFFYVRIICVKDRECKEVATTHCPWKGQQSCRQLKNEISLSVTNETWVDGYGCHQGQRSTIHTCKSKAFSFICLLSSAERIKIVPCIVPIAQLSSRPGCVAFKYIHFPLTWFCLTSSVRCIVQDT